MLAYMHFKAGSSGATLAGLTAPLHLEKDGEKRGKGEGEGGGRGEEEGRERGGRSHDTHAPPHVQSLLMGSSPHR